MPTYADDLTERRMFDATDIMRLAQCKPNKAYEIIRNLNKELKSQGYFIIRGRTPAGYAIQRLGLKL